MVDCGTDGSSHDDDEIKRLAQLAPGAGSDKRKHGATAGELRLRAARQLADLVAVAVAPLKLLRPVAVEAQREAIRARAPELAALFDAPRVPNGLPEAPGEGRHGDPRADVDEPLVKPAA